MLIPNSQQAVVASISVVMSVHNGAEYVADAIESILAQTFADFEFIIIDDGSTDRSLEIIRSYAMRDDRVRVLVHEVNQGLARSLNRGIASARGDLIARMDADDISLPERFAVQTQFLREHPDVDLVGSWAEFMDEDGKAIGEVRRYPSTAMGLRWCLLFMNHLWHPTVMARRRFFDAAQYDETFDTTQDFELWARRNLVARYRNIERVLLRYREHGSSTSTLRRASQMVRLCEISRRTISSYLGEDISAEVVRFVMDPYRVDSVKHYLVGLATLRRLSRKFRRDHHLHPAERVEVNLDLANRYSRIAYSNLRFPLSWLLRLWAICIVLHSLTLRTMISWLPPGEPYVRFPVSTLW